MKRKALINKNFLAPPKNQAGGLNYILMRYRSALSYAVL